jgi:E3 ubiquitin-protein ligase BOI-like protein
MGWFLCRDFIKHNQGNADMAGAQMYSGVPLAGTMPETLLPFYQSVDCNLGSEKPVMNKADSGLSNIYDQRKRPRDSMINQFDDFIVPQKRNKISVLPSFLCQDIIFQAQQQQSEIDRFLAQHVIIHSFALISFSFYKKSLAERKRKSFWEFFFFFWVTKQISLCP